MTIKNITIIGTGNVGWHLGNAFKQAGVEIDHVAGRDIDKAKLLSEYLQTKSYGTLNEELPDSDIYILAVKDDVIRTVAEKVYKPGRILIHHAGAIGAGILQMKDNVFGVMWPMQTLTKNNTVALEHTLIAISGSNIDLLYALRELAGKITDRVIEVSDEQRAVLHLAAVWVNNYTNHMFDIASTLLKENGLELELFYPIMEEHFEKLKQLSPDQLQTGPAIRGDLSTMSKHKTMLQNHKEWQLLYDSLANSILHKYLKQ